MSVKGTSFEYVARLTGDGEIKGELFIDDKTEGSSASDFGGRGGYEVTVSSKSEGFTAVHRGE